ncbi:DUF3857 domain-containing protein [Flavobacteriaceae bacterium R38]|nr:DUF3857 domain-containing protein [Flavobacteriaceae bacterium R38]
MNIRPILLLFICVFYYEAYSQNLDYSYLSIPEGLTKKANAIVRLDETEINLSSLSKMEVTRHRIVTILNKNGRGAENAFVNYDPGIEIRKIEARVYDQLGKEIRKIKKNDFKDVSAAQDFSLYEDNRVKYVSYTPTSYPYTIEISYTISTKNTAFIRGWHPVDEYLVSTEKSKYKFIHNNKVKYRIKEKNFEGYDIIKKNETNYISYELSNLPSVTREDLSPAYHKTEPSLIVGLDKFHLEGVDGQASDWKSMGKWQYDKLLTNRDDLSPETIDKVSSMLAGIDDPIEKAKRIYQYVQENTRYISVQLGIGGWMPIHAKEVDKVKYGDCKGLTNYTKALLKSQGIESYYSVVYAGDGYGKKNMEPGFASMQGNHVILNIPNGEEDIWLECTSQVLPFGFLGNFTDDRDVLVIKPEGGEIKRTKSYINEENKMFTKASYSLSETGEIQGKVTIETKGIQYNNHYRIKSLSDQKQDEYYKRYWGSINGLEVNNIQLTNNKKAILFKEEIDVAAKQYGEIINDRILLQVNAFDVNTNIPRRYRNRKQAFEIMRGFLDEDEFTITLPDAFSPELLVTPIKIENDFGTYEVEMEMKSAKELLYKRKLFIKKGTYAKEDYNKYRNFRRQIAKNDKLKLVLIKQKT